MPYSYEPHYFEDLEIGQTFESAGRTVTETDFVVHSMFTGDWTELHTNKEYSEDGPFGARIAQGPLSSSRPACSSAPALSSAQWSRSSG